MMNKTDFEAVLQHVKFPNFKFAVLEGTAGICFLQIQCEGTCNVTGEAFDWKGRKWYLSHHMTVSEVITTAFKAVMTAMEHETREQFMYNGQAIFGPHLDVKLLHDVCVVGGTDERIDER